MIGSDLASVSRPNLSGDGSPVDTRVERLVALDHLRGFIVGLVVLHHAVLAYCTFGHVDRANYVLSTAPIVDPQRWVGFDVLVRINDGFFMPLLFLISGLFVQHGLIHHGPRQYLRLRMRRLGLPFTIAVLTIVPLAYYPSFLQAGGTSGFGRFWLAKVNAGPWPAGPPWFIGVLLIFDAAAALVFSLAGRPDAGHQTPRAATAFMVLLAGSGLLYLPLLLIVGPTQWFALGPLAIQGSRIGLYATYFAAGVALGRGGTKSVSQFAETLAPRWPAWTFLATTAAAMFLALGPLSLVLRGVAQAAYCAAAGFAALALFLRFGRARSLAWDSLATNSFGIYLLHYPFVTWTHYGLLAVPVDAPMKGALTFALALAASWASTSLLRRLPVVGQLL